MVGRSNAVQGHVKTQLIAHDKEVYDIAFSRAGGGRDMFASVGRLPRRTSVSDLYVALYRLNYWNCYSAIKGLFTGFEN